MKIKVIEVQGEVRWEDVMGRRLDGLDIPASLIKLVCISIVQ